MTKEEKQLLLIDLCARLPYGVICRKDCKTVDNEDFYLDKYPNPIELAKYLTIDDMDITIKPYLRPLSSMTEEECDLYDEAIGKDNEALMQDNGDAPRVNLIPAHALNFLLSRHFDFRGLNPRALP